MILAPTNRPMNESKSMMARMRSGFFESFLVLVFMAFGVWVRLSW